MSQFYDDDNADSILKEITENLSKQVSEELDNGNKIKVTNNNTNKHTNGKKPNKMKKVLIGIGSVVVNDIEKNKIKVPEKISILGFDDIEWTKVTTPELSTIHQRKKKLGYLSMKKLISSINKEVINETSTVLDSYIVERESIKELNNK